MAALVGLKHLPFIVVNMPVKFNQHHPVYKVHWPVLGRVICTGYFLSKLQSGERVQRCYTVTMFGPKTRSCYLIVLDGSFY